MKIGDWGLGIGDWAQSPIPNPLLSFKIKLKVLFCIFNKNDPINYLINFKKKVLSEEEIFTHHFLLKSLRHAFIEKSKT